MAKSIDLFVKSFLSKKTKHPGCPEDIVKKNLKYSKPAIRQFDRIDRIEKRIHANNSLLNTDLLNKKTVNNTKSITIQCRGIGFEYELIISPLERFE